MHFLRFISRAQGSDELTCGRTCSHLQIVAAGCLFIRCRVHFNYFDNPIKLTLLSYVLREKFHMKS